MTIRISILIDDVTEESIDPCPRHNDLDDLAVHRCCMESEIYALLNGEDRDNDIFSDPTWDMSGVFAAADNIVSVLPDCYYLEEVFFDDASRLNLVYSVTHEDEADGNES